MENDRIPDVCFHSFPPLNDNRYTLLGEINSDVSLWKEAYKQLGTYAMALYLSEDEAVIRKGNKTFVFLVIMPNEFQIAVF